MRHAAGPAPTMIIESDGSDMGLLAIAIGLVLFAIVIIPLVRFFGPRSR